MNRFKLYHSFGQRNLKTWLHPRGQLEQHDECRCVLSEFEQCPDEYQFQHWFSGCQELQPPSEISFFNFWSQELWSITVTTSVHDDLPFALSQPASVFSYLVAKDNSSGRIPRICGFSPQALPKAGLWIN